MRRVARSLSVAALFLCVAFAQTRPSPKFTVKRLSGDPIKIESLRGKIVVLTFIMTTCPHCQDLTEHTLIPASTEYSPRGVEFIECAVDETAPKLLPDFVSRFKPPFPIGYASQSDVNGYTGRSVVDNRPFYVPHIVFIDRQGVIRAEYPGESNFAAQAPTKLREELDKLLAAKETPKGGRAAKTSTK